MNTPSTARRLVASVTLLSFTLQPFAALAAGVVADPGAGPRKPLVDTTANGLPLVQITTPSAAGVSHNQYSQYNVDSRGVILNNARTLTQTQQGGYVDGNPNLTGSSARVILNEVTSSNPSLLQGYTEVAGSRAEVIIANPNGITCNGCGFINTSRGVLTTGVPVFGGSGSLDAFRVTGGNIAIGSLGLNAANTDQLDLITRSVVANGQLWAKQLNVVTGANQVGYADLATQAITGNGAAPAVSIDVALLGGMYANKIRLVGTEAGVGVVSLGTIAAQAGDLTLDAKGRITLNGNTNATGNLSINTQDSLTNTATLYGQGNVSITATQGITNSNILAAGNDLSITAANLASNGVLASGLNPDGSLGAHGNLTVATTGSITALGQNLAGGNLSLSGSSIDLSNTQTAANGNVTLTSTGNINHGNSDLVAGGALSLTASGSVVNDAANITAAQLSLNAASLSNIGGSLSQSGTGNTALTLTGALDNTHGNIDTNGQALNIQSASLTNTQGNISHAGSGLLTVTTGNLTNTQGKLISNGSASLTTALLDNSSGLLSTGASATINASGGLVNSAGVVQSGGQLNLNAASVDNSAGRIVALGNTGLTLTTTGSVTNTTGTTASNELGGVIGGNGDVTLNVGSLVNTGSISANQNLTLTATGALNNANGAINAAQAANLTASQIDNSHATISAAQITLTTTVGGLNNTGGNITQAGAAATALSITGALDNTHGNLATNGQTLTIQSSGFDNTQGQVTHAGTGLFTLNTGNLTNHSGNMVTNGSTNIHAQALDNSSGSLVVAGSTGITATQALDNSAGNLQAGGQLTLSAASVNNSAGRIVSLGTQGLSLTTAGSVTNTTGTTTSNELGGVIGGNGDVTLNVGSLANTGSLSANQNLTLTATGALNNANGAINAAQAANLTASQIDNSHATISADQITLTTTAGGLNNTGGNITQTGAAATAFSIAGALDNTQGDIGTNAGNFTLQSASVINAQGNISHAGSGSLELTTGALSNSNGSIATNGTATLAASSITNQHGSVSAQGGATLNSSGTVDNANGYLGADSLHITAATQTSNAGGTIEANHAVSLNAQRLDNTGGVVKTLGNSALTVTTSQDVANNTGFIGGNGTLGITAGSIDNTGGNVYAKDQLNLTSAGQVNNHNGAIRTDADLNLTATGALNNTQGVIEANGSGSSLSLNTGSIDNSGGRIANSGSAATTINGGSQISNSNAAAVSGRGVIGGNADVSLTANNISNTQGAKLISGHDLTINATTGLNNTGGSAYAVRDLGLTQSTTAVDNSGGTLSAGRDLNLKAASFTNIGGKLLTDRDLKLQANTLNGIGQMLAARDVALNLQGNATGESAAHIKADRDVALSLSGSFSNQGKLEAVNQLMLTAASINNQSGASMNADQTVLTTSGALTNAGSISGNTVTTTSNAFTNTGSVIGDAVSITSNSLSNSGSAAIIAATSGVNLYVSNSLSNLDGATIYSLGDMLIAADAQHAKTASILNSSATIQADHDLAIYATDLTNQKTTFATALQQVSSTPYEIDYLPNYVAIWQQYFPYINNKYIITHVNEIGTITQNESVAVQDSAAGQILAGNNMGLDVGGTLTNQYSAILAGANMALNAGTLNNVAQQKEVQVIKSGYYVGYAYKPSSGSCGNNSCPQVGYFPTEETVNYVAWPEASGVIAANQSVSVNAVSINNQNVTASGAPVGNAATLGAGQAGGLNGNLNNGSVATVSASATTQTTGNNVNAPTASSATGTQTTANHVTAAPAGVGTLPGSLPTSGLYHTQPAPNQQYLVETNPRFTNYNSFISSDYMLSRLSLDPQRVQKRLGDGFYEQKLVLDQVAQLTGRRYLGNNTDGQQQFQALMESGVAEANALHLTPGIALTDAQIANLTHDIVWMEEETVTLPDGGSTVVLAPKVYLTRLHAEDLTPSGAVIAANEIDLVAHDTLSNSGTIQSTGRMKLAANDISNVGGTIRSDAGLSLSATRDVLNQSGSISGKSVTLTAGRDISNTTATQAISNNTLVSQRGSIGSTGGDLTVAAGRDLTMNAASISATGNAALSAGQNIAVGTEISTTRRGVVFSTTQLSSNLTATQNLTLQSGADMHLTSTQINAGNNLTAIANGNLTIDAAKNVDKTDYEFIRKRSRNIEHSVDETVVSGELKAGGNVTLAAVAPTPPAAGSANTGNNVSIAAANISTDTGKLSIVADGNVDLTVAHENDSSYKEVYNKKKGFLSSKSKLNIDQSQSDTAIGNTLSADSISIQAGGNLTATGTSVVATNAVDLSAAKDVTIQSAESTASESHLSQTKKSGLSFSGGSIGIGSSKLNSNGSQQTTTQTASTIGSLNGDISIAAGKTYNQTGSDLLTPQGNIDITAGTVNISAAQETSRSQQSTTFKQSGLSIGISSPVINAVQTVSDMAKAAKETSDPRMQALAAATAALAAKNGYDAIIAGNTAQTGGGGLPELDANGQTTAENPINQLGGLSLNISFGSSKSSSQSSSTATTAKSSSVVAGGDVSIAATDGDLNVVGSKISAGRDAVLSAANQVNLLAAANTSSNQSSNKSSSASFGVSLSSTGGLGVNAGVSKAKGKSNGSDVSYTNTTVSSGSTTVIESGTDTNIKGATVSGRQVIADVGTSGSGNLNVESLQDSSTYNSSQKSAGVSLGITTSGVVSGSVSGSKSNINSNYQSVTEQSGIKAGDGGFEINVNGNTDLKGAVIASTDQAIKDDANRLTTQTLTTSTVENKAEYSASSTSLGLGYSTSGSGVGTDSKGKPTTEPNNGPALPSLNGVSATPPVATSAGDEASSTTRSAISAGSITIADNAAQEALTGKDATTTVALLDRDTANAANPLTPIFTEQTKADIQAGQTIIGAFSGQVGTFLSNRAKEADQKTQAAKDADATADSKQSEADALPDGEQKAQLEQEIAQLRQTAITARLDAQAVESNWGAGGTYRQLLTAATAAASGNITGSSGEWLQSTLVNVLQAKTAEEIKQLADDLGIAEGSPAHAALHALNACAGAAAQGNSCSTAAMGAATASVVSQLMLGDGENAETLTNEQKQARENLVATLVTGVASLSDQAATANTAALTELENNSNVKNAVKAAINDAKAYLGKKAREGGEGLVNLLDKLESKTLVEKKEAISQYIIEAGARGGLTDAEVLVFATLYSANELLFPTGVLDAIPAGGKIVKRGGELIKAGVRAEDAAKVATREVESVIHVDRKGNALIGDWSTTKTLTSPENALAHWNKHAAEFPEFTSADQYIEGAQKFVSNPPAGTLTKIKSNGDVMIYNPISNTFAVKTSTGAPRTMFKPDPAKHGYSTNLEYFNAQ